ncbi:MAG: hypothetical protein PHW46_03850 [Candidatus Omnitrophica bacterium]|nr:hypothetical protein [Candidatus Omnitrophota bacterium]
MKRSISVFIIIIFLAAFCYSAASTMAKNAPRPPRAEDKDLSDRLLSQTFAAYENYTRNVFTDIVSKDFIPDRFQMIDGVERNFYAAKPVDIDYFINKVEPGNGTLAISFTWNKKEMMRSNGSQRMEKGSSSFVYKKSDDRWQLYSIKGRSPFL